MNGWLVGWTDATRWHGMRGPQHLTGGDAGLGMRDIGDFQAVDPGAAALCQTQTRSACVQWSKSAGYLTMAVLKAMLHPTTTYQKESRFVNTANSLYLCINMTCRPEHNKWPTSWAI
ncbi:hypothetical protein HRR80_9613 [Exophiala dermatitidis]|uniref:Uncharacterized protein n=1 Tax=Exophiala dermatitidis TaxID=5970 RepID=A0AAN6F0A4_EXODE|nr:hypothetical protein HRR77_006843 [Exophiala dermatitidis]KAJ4583785.1 hypothetical protein HRR82_003128 [Exophiala dermatitidis]KAJ4599540.1 hypothetical protein HRR84_003291 [Exophiala dermatitidis]KAJ4623901.1 hypothetical protein HRR85_000754 [Exophiala dermatitidis]KAJ4625210.1 hypothetical protein HRR88_004921 [Exophiala dermatitidis]